jgi:hypothetical protein
MIRIIPKFILQNLMQMKRIYALSAFFTGILFVCTPTFPQNSKDLSNVNFTYRYPSERTIPYLHSTTIHEVMDIQGQSMNVDVSSNLACKIKSSGMLKNYLGLEIGIDSLVEVINSPQGMAGGIISETQGRIFHIVITPNGKTADVDEARRLSYNVEGSGKENMMSAFIDFFPLLPEGNVSPGYTWTSKDTIRTDSDMNAQVTIISSQYKFEGFEDLMGQHCAKFTSVNEGSTVMNNNAQGMEMKTTGNFTGNTVSYFSPEEGYFIKYETNSKLTGRMEMTSPDSYNFPVVVDIHRVSEVKK